MMDQNPKYIAAINIISHLVLTKPEVARKFLANHSVPLAADTSPKQLIHEIIDLISINDPEIMEDLTSLFASHLTFKGKELLALGGKIPVEDEDQFLGGMLSAASSIAKGIGGLFGAKKQRKAKEAAHKREMALANTKAKAQAVAEKAKADAFARMQAMERSRQLHAAKLKALAERKKEEKAEKKEEERKATQEKYFKYGMAGVGLIALLLVATKLLPKKAPIPVYNPTPSA